MCKIEQYTLSNVKICNFSIKKYSGLNFEMLGQIEPISNVFNDMNSKYLKSTRTEKKIALIKSGKRPNSVFQIKRLNRDLFSILIYK